MIRRGDIRIPTYDVIIVGAGPAGAEAALSSARSGAGTLCLTINLDTAGFPPASPILVEDSSDPRGALLEEMSILGARLPALLADDGISTAAADGRLRVDRRLLGLAYKEAVESEAGLEFRQSLVTGIAPRDGGWRVETRLGEEFEARALVLAAGTFLEGKVAIGGRQRDGGRPGEIPSNSLALCLQNMGFKLERITAHADARLSLVSYPPPGEEHPEEYPLDGSQLGESYAYGLGLSGDIENQLSLLRSGTGSPGAWITRPAFSVTHSVLSPGQLGPGLESVIHPGLFAAGRFAGSCSYLEAAALGSIAGTRAAARASGRHEPYNLINNTILVDKLREQAMQAARPFTIRDIEPGTC